MRVTSPHQVPPPAEAASLYAALDDLIKQAPPPPPPPPPAGHEGVFRPTQASPAPARQEDAAAKILKLKGLLDAGAISQAEFDQKKQEWLDKM